jgi:hypothetical protein
VRVPEGETVRRRAGPTTAFGGAGASQRPRPTPPPGRWAPGRFFALDHEGHRAGNFGAQRAGRRQPYLVQRVQPQGDGGDLVARQVHGVSGEAVEHHLALRLAAALLLEDARRGVAGVVEPQRVDDVVFAAVGERGGERDPCIKTETRITGDFT